MGEQAPECENRHLAAVEGPFPVAAHIVAADSLGRYQTSRRGTSVRLTWIQRSLERST